MSDQSNHHVAKLHRTARLRDHACDVYTVAEVATRLGVGEKLVYRAITMGQLPARRLGRLLVIPIPAFERWLESGGSVAARPTRERRRSSANGKKGGPRGVVASDRAQDPHQDREE